MVKKIGELSEREGVVKRMREEQKRTYVSIGRELGIGAQRVAQIYHRAVWEVKAEQKHPFRGLGTRAANILFYNEIEDREGVRAVWNGKKLGLRLRRGIGKATLGEILRWAGIEEPVAAEVRRCRLCGRKL